MCAWVCILKAYFHYVWLLHRLCVCVCVCVYVCVCVWAYNYVGVYLCFSCLRFVNHLKLLPLFDFLVSYCSLSLQKPSSYCTLSYQEEWVQSTWSNLSPVLYCPKQVRCQRRKRVNTNWPIRFQETHDVSFLIG